METPILLGKVFFLSSNARSQEETYQITGILKDLPSNTHLPVDLLTSFRNENERRGWAYVYTLLRQGASLQHLETKLDEFLANHLTGVALERVSLVFQPLKEIYLHEPLAREIIPNGNPTYIWILQLVSYLILAIALINFISLTSALSTKKGKEIAVRKILGAQKKHHFIFAITESITFQLLALVIGAVLAFLIFPYFRQLTDIELTLNLLVFLSLLIAIALLGGILAAIYPAIVLNNMKVIESIKGVSRASRPILGLDVRKLLVGLQFTATLFLIGGAIAAYKQVHFLHQKDLGLKKEQILAIPSVPDAVTAKYQIFKDQVQSINGIQQVAACMQVPSESIRDVGPVLVEGINDDPTKAPMMDMQVIDQNFIDLMEVELIAGQVPIEAFKLKPIPEFTENFTFLDYINQTPRAYLINETALEQLGFEDPQSAIGRNINWSIGQLSLATGPIAGVVKDFHQETLKHKIDPMVLTFEPLWLRTFLVKVETDDLSKTLSQVQNIWDQNFKQYPFEYQFLDTLFDQLYKTESNQVALLTWFSLLSIIIAGIGLISLVAYSLYTREKEMAIRKVLGANAAALIRLISKEYLLVMSIGGMIGIPLSYFVVRKWLENFAYHTDHPIGFYVLAFFIVIGIILFVIGGQTLLATQKNPANRLKDS